MEKKEKTILEYKGYTGSIEFSEEDDCFFGSLMGLEKVNSVYDGKTLDELESRFREIVDLYLEMRKELRIFQCPGIGNDF